MALSYKIDYVVAPNAWHIADDGIFVGTRTHLYFIPTKVRSWEGQRRQIETTYHLGGDNVKEVLPRFLQLPDLTLERFHQEMDKWQGEMPEMKTLVMDDLARFRVKSSWIGSSIMFKEVGDMGWTLFCHKLGKARENVKAFYQDLEK